MCEHDGLIGIGDHVYLLRGFENWTVKLIDPKNGKEIEKDYVGMIREMGHGGIFSLVKSLGTS